MDDMTLPENIARVERERLAQAEQATEDARYAERAESYEKQRTLNAKLNELRSDLTEIKGTFNKSKDIDIRYSLFLNQIKMQDKISSTIKMLQTIKASFGLQNLNESSMEHPTSKEEHSLMQIKGCYSNTLIDQGGPNVVVDNLRTELITRYKLSPAKITIQGKEVSLPDSYQEFDDLTKRWSESDKKKALESYYKNENHTALRYLSNPNKWIHPNAMFVYATDGIATHSTFDKHMEIIALMWIAAKDDDQKPTIHGMSVGDRENLFIIELAQLNRAHNADERMVAGQDGITKKVTEDDMLADKPSCSPGVLKRILQSVIGHPIIDGLLTPQKLEDHLLDFIRTKFEEKMQSNIETKGQLVQILSAIIEGNDSPFDSAATTEIKSRLNISKEELLEFILDLSRKYGDGFTEDRLNFTLKKFTSAYHADFPQFTTILNKVLDVDIQKSLNTEKETEDVSNHEDLCNHFKKQIQNIKKTIECDDTTLEMEEVEDDWVNISKSPPISG